MNGIATADAVRPSGDATAPTLDGLAAVCERAAAGDLEARVVGLMGHPELGRLSLAINAMLDGADSFVREAAAAMENCSHDQFHRPILQRGMKGAYRQSAAVINAAGAKMRQGRDEIMFVGGLAADNLHSVQAVADSLTQLNETSSRIAREATGAAQSTQLAVGEAERASDAVRAMNDAVKAIDGMVRLINQVAEQTNLLALNATIEAARAGESGKGFAVVASEVKELSRNTGRATGDISAQVEKLQRTAREVGTLIGGIRESIRRIDESAVTISGSVSDQVRATADIGRSIREVEANATQVSERIRGTATDARSAGAA